MKIRWVRMGRRGQGFAKLELLQQIVTPPSFIQIKHLRVRMEKATKRKQSQSLVKALEAVQSNLPSLKERFDKAHTPAERGTHWQYERVNQSQFCRRQCNACHASGVDKCYHRFKCGSTDHLQEDE